MLVLKAPGDHPDFSFQINKITLKRELFMAERCFPKHIWKKKKKPYVEQLSILTVPLVMHQRPVSGDTESAG